MPFICKVYFLSFWALPPELNQQLKLHLLTLLLALNGFLNIYHVDFFTKSGFLLICMLCYFQRKCIVQKAYECLSHTESAGGSKNSERDQNCEAGSNFCQQNECQRVY